MKTKRLTDFEAEEEEAETSVSTQKKEEPKPITLESFPMEEYEEKPPKKPKWEPEVVDQLPPSYVFSVFYDGKRKKACVKLYEPKSGKMYLWVDSTDHHPYCLSFKSIHNLHRDPRLRNVKGLRELRTVMKHDPIMDQDVYVTVIVAEDPLTIGGKKGSIRDRIEVFEADIKYHNSFLYDLDIIPGMLYEVVDGSIKKVPYEPPKEVVERVLSLLSDEPPEMLEYSRQLLALLECPIPDVDPVAVDIEIETEYPTKVPDARAARNRVICVSFYSSSVKKVLLLRRKGVDVGNEQVDAEIEYYDDERSLVERAFELLCSFPIVLTFNGDDFDLRYLRHRAENLGIPPTQIPIKLGRSSAQLAYGIHLDLYKFFFNKSIQTYAFGNKYKDVTLDELGSCLVGLSKVVLEKPISELSYTELAKYCLRDAEITYKLATFDEKLVLKLIFVISRVCKLPPEDVCRYSISKWIKSALYYEHRRRNYLIPSKDYIARTKGGTAEVAPVTKGKKYKGAIVISPVKGIHFNVVVLDFASLYPSIMKRWNLSYETLLCPHKECMENVVHAEGVSRWVCTKKRGITSLFIGSLRDLRVRYYKPMSKRKDLPSAQRAWYQAIQSSLKVILNASYGVFGAEHFALYCLPLAEFITALGRKSIKETIKKAQEMGMKVIYGDTDSLFLANPSEEKMKALMEWSKKELGIELDVDKVYRYAVFSERKKNYFGVFPDGSVDVKGLVGRKSNTPKFLQVAFQQVLRILSQVKSAEEFEEAKRKIFEIIRDYYVRLKRKQLSLEELAFTVVLGKDIHAYKVEPQHVKAAKMLESHLGRPLGVGDTIRYVKVRTKDGVKPVELVKSLDEIDDEKYVEHMRTMFSQILEPLGIDFDEILGTVSLRSFFEAA